MSEMIHALGMAFYLLIAQIPITWKEQSEDIIFITIVKITPKDWWEELSLCVCVCVDAAKHMYSCGHAHAEH